VDVGESDFGEAGSEPVGSHFLPKGWRGYGDQFSLAIDEGLGIVVHPRKRAMHCALRSACRYSSEGRASREDRHAISE
jgi:hypothetical protein